MILERLIRQLGKEARRSPKKAALLGVLCLVAAWFWGPLLWHWVVPKQTLEEASVTQGGVASGVLAAPGAAGQVVPSPVVAAAPPGPASSAFAKAAAGAQPAAQPDWRKLAEWKRADRLAQPAELPPGVRDPFVSLVPSEPEATLEAEAMPEPEPAVAQAAADPASLGLVLTSTIVGPTRRAARINNKTYQPGQTIAVSKDGRLFEFVLAEVHPRHVVLTDQSARYELSLPKPDLSDAIRPMQAAGEN